MGFLVWRPLRRWVIAGLALPVVVWLLDRFSDAWCERRGDGIVVKGLRRLARWLRRHERGPLADDRA
ncbi:hypothetical protein [Euzebya sp.]|uniref:hypothetical protein n=1 Tax=Euzebya sp. TaxID=1971409 RepID=UPI0035193950